MGMGVGNVFFPLEAATPFLFYCDYGQRIVGHLV